VGAILNILNVLLGVYGFILLCRALISWVPVDRSSPIVRMLFSITEPVLAPIREALPQTGMIDFSTAVALVIVFALQQLLTILAR